MTARFRTRKVRRVQPRDLPIAILGAGFAGIGTAIRLRKAGIELFTIFERAGEIGGTWRDNTYPGAACDVPSHVYSLSFEQNPAPLFLKNIRGISRQWMELPGGQWGVCRILAEVELRGGWTGLVPDRAELAILLNDYRFDGGYDERRFGPYGRK